MLIAAAPDLLEACQMAIDYFLAPIGEFVDQHGVVSQQQMLDRLVAAVTKATGKI